MNDIEDSLFAIQKQTKREKRESIGSWVLHIELLLKTAFLLRALRIDGLGMGHVS